MARRPLDEECRRSGEAQGSRAPSHVVVDLHARATTRSHESDGTDADLEVLRGAQLATFTPLDGTRRPVPAPEPCERQARAAPALGLELDLVQLLPGSAPDSAQP
jgi:hypothetical protein